MDNKTPSTLSIQTTARAPRPDEQKALNLLVEYLKNLNMLPNKAIYEPSGPNTAPDYLLDFGSHSVLVEMRNSGDGFILLPDLTLHSRERYEISADAMIKKIENDVNKWLNPAKTVILMISSPIPPKKRGQMAKKIARELKKSYQNKTLALDQTIKIPLKTPDLQIPILFIEARLTNYYANKIEYSSVKSILGASLQSPAPVLQANLSEQARYILDKAIKEKSDKLRNLEGKKWLVIINNHLLLDEYIYSLAFNKIKNESPSIEFEKIFIVSSSAVKQLPMQRSPLE